MRAKLLNSFTIFELLLVLGILSIIYLSSFQILLDSYTLYSDKKESFYSKLDLETTFLFLNKRADNIVANTLDIDELNSKLISIEWLEYDSKEIIGSYRYDTNYSEPTISTILDLDSSSKKYLTLIDSDFSNRVVNALLYFPSNGRSYIIKGYDSNRLYFESEIDIAFEHYRVVYSAYSIIFTNNSLYFCYDYRPWLGDNIDSASKTLLLDRVKSVDVSKVNSEIFLKIIREDSNETAVEQKVF